MRTRRQLDVSPAMPTAARMNLNLSVLGMPLNCHDLGLARTSRGLAHRSLESCVNKCLCNLLWGPAPQAIRIRGDSAHINSTLCCCANLLSRRISLAAHSGRGGGRRGDRSDGDPREADLDGEGRTGEAATIALPGGEASLVSHETIVNLIGSTTTKTGLRVRSKLDLQSYETGKKVPRRSCGSSIFTRTTSMAR